MTNITKPLKIDLLIMSTVTLQHRKFYISVFFAVTGISHYSSKENGFRVFVPQRRPLDKEVVRYRVQDLSCEGQRLHPTNTFNINYQDFLHSQNSKQESCHAQGNAGPRAITQHLKQQQHKHKKGGG